MKSFIFDFIELKGTDYVDKTMIQDVGCFPFYHKPERVYSSLEKDQSFLRLEKMDASIKDLNTSTFPRPDYIFNANWCFASTALMSNINKRDWGKVKVVSCSWGPVVLAQTLGLTISTWSSFSIRIQTSRPVSKTQRNEIILELSTWLPTCKIIPRYAVLSHRV